MLLIRVCLFVSTGVSCEPRAASRSAIPSAVGSPKEESHHPEPPAAAERGPSEVSEP